MTTYGTIPTSSSPETENFQYMSGVKARVQAGLGIRRPWKEMFNFRSFNLPSSFRDALSRIQRNIGYFRMNYAIVILFIVFLSLLWHPISLIVFIVMMAAWLFLYFLRDEPLVIFGHTIDDRVILALLSILTLVFLLLTKVTLNVLISVLVGLAVVAIHGAFRKTDNLFLDEDGAGTARLFPGASATTGKRPLGETSSTPM